MARYLTKRDAFIRTRWSLYLGVRVGRGRRVAVEQLDKELQDVLSRESRGAALLWRYLKGDKTTVSAGHAFAIGEALRRLGYASDGGPVALYASGHHAFVIALLAQLAEINERTAAVAINLLAALPIAVEPEIDILREGHNLDFELECYAVANSEDHPLLQARTFVAKSLASLPHGTLDEAWDRTYYREKPLRGIRSEAVKEAFRIASSLLLPDRAREAAWFILDEWEAGFEESWPPRERYDLRRAYGEWRKRVATKLDHDKDARAAADRDARRPPEERAAREALLASTKPESSARPGANQRKQKGNSE
jgi:hypothetical protein